MLIISILICMSLEHFCEGWIPRDWSVAILSFKKGSSTLICGGFCLLGPNIYLTRSFFDCIFIPCFGSLPPLNVQSALGSEWAGMKGRCDFEVTEVAGRERSCEGLFFHSHRREFSISPVHLYNPKAWPCRTGEGVGRTRPRPGSPRGSLGNGAYPRHQNQ